MIVSQKTTTKPNIVMILLDDMGYWTLGSHGNHEILTPNIDALADRSLNFKNCYCVSPVCSPARASLLTGRIPSQHGVLDWIRNGSIKSDDDRPVEYLEGLKLTAKELRQQGISGEQFRTSLLEHSASTVRDLVSSS